MTYLPYIIGLAIFLIWMILFRERIGYIAANPLISKYQRIPLRIVGLWILRLSLIMTLVWLTTGVGKTVIQTVREKEKHNILIILDISRSMLAEDITPSRIEAAKSTIQTFIAERTDDIFSLVVFAGKPFVSIPFSTDTRGIASVVSHITPGYIRQNLPGLSGTAIGDAILLANMTLSGQSDASSIVLITDGRANIGIDPLIAAAESRMAGIPIYTLAIGGTTDTPLSYTDPYTNKRIQLLDEDNNPLKNDIDEALLQEISDTTGGKYFRATQARELYGYWDSIAERIGQRERTVERTVTQSYGVPLLILLIILLTLERWMTPWIFYKKQAE